MMTPYLAVRAASFPISDVRPSTIYAVYPGNRLTSMKVPAFVDHLARCFGGTPYWDTEL